MIVCVSGVYLPFRLSWKKMSLLSEFIFYTLVQTMNCILHVALQMNLYKVYANSSHQNCIGTHSCERYGCMGNL